VQLSPLQLLEYTFDGVAVTPVEGYVADPKFSTDLVFFPGQLAMSAETGLAMLSEEANYSDYGIKLILRVAPKEEKQAPYNVQIAVRGVVRIHLKQEENQAEERRVRALVNGVSLLYGVVREMVSNITSRSAHGGMLLPSLNFADLATQKPTVDPVVDAPKLRAPRVRRKAAAKRVRSKA
jgi:preprotein translocase subunit SecB